MAMRIGSFLVIFSIAIGGLVSAKLVEHPEQESVSIIQLIANPKAFDKKYVDVAGYLKISDEYENSLYLDHNAFRHGMTANSIAISFDGSPKDIVDRSSKYDRKYVVVAGQFEAGPTAFSGGELHDIYYIAPVSPRTK